MRDSKVQFVRSLGYLERTPDDRLYSALMLQPRLVGAMTVIGVLLQASWPFLALSAALLWSAAFPARSLFDAIYNYGVARPRGLPRLAPAPAPRRFAGGLAGIVALVTGLALLTGARVIAWPLEALLVVAVAGVLFKRACAGADIYNVLRRHWPGTGRTAVVQHR